MRQPAEVPALSAQGVSRLFGPGTPTRDIVAYLRQAVRAPPDEKLF
jgi:methylmalonyl-CoA mutase cobalamin-binding subunit